MTEWFALGLVMGLMIGLGAVGLSDWVRYHD